MKVVVLSEEIVIEGKLYRKGEVVVVDDQFDNTLIKKTLSTDYVSPEVKVVKKLEQEEKSKPTKPPVEIKPEDIKPK